MSTKKQKKTGKAHLQRIIDLCHSVEEKNVDPFIVEVDDIIDTIQKYFPEWGNPEELCLDAEAVHQLASTIKLQSEWVKHRSTSLYTDPFLLQEKLLTLPKEEIAATFLQSWNPVVEFQQLTTTSFTEATGYWRNLAPIDERWNRIEGIKTQAGTASREDLLAQQIIAEKEFSERLLAFWEELKRKSGAQERIEYWDFIGAETYEETVKRAYLTSFLITYGYATLEIDWLEEIIQIKPLATPSPATSKRQAASLPVPVAFDDWRRWREGVTP